LVILKNLREKDMSESTTDQVRALASLVGISITEQDLPEVANRFSSLMAELNTLNELELADIQPVSVFPDESEDGV
jgi:Asp-tRNA(Asn)/Glu-tRNA(Gln) amidotransferase C subunit